METPKKQSTSSEKEKEDLSVSSYDNSGEFKLHPLSEKSLGYSPEGSPISSDRTSLSHGSSPARPKEEQTTPSFPSQNPPGKLAPNPQAPKPSINRHVVEEPASLKKKADARGHVGSVEEGGQVGGSGRRFRPSLSILRAAKKEQLVKRTALGFRVFGFMFCLVSLSVMAADKHQGWALDSFDRYKEFRYCLFVNIIGFVYSAVQALDLGYQLFAGSSILRHRYRCLFDFATDQMISYLLISASSSAATRVEDWELNWGEDKFPQMAAIAVSMSFLAFAALASNSLISGYVLCISRSS